jgi:hypothetical protein
MSNLIMDGDIQTYEIADAYRELFNTELELFDYLRPYTALELWAQIPEEVRKDVLRCIFDLREGVA